MAKPKMVVYTGTSDTRIIGELTWSAENNWAVKQADVPADIMKEMKEGSLVGEFDLGVDSEDVEDTGVTEVVE